MTTDRHKSIIVPKGTTLRRAYQAIDASSLMIVLVTDAADRLVGTATDGDIRRGLLRGLTLDSPVDEVMNTAPTTAPAGSDPQDLFNLMRHHHVSQIPIVDAEGRVVGLQTMAGLVEAPPPTPTPVVILAGGFGRRLQPLTNHIPKPMLDVGGRPLLERLLQRLAAQGFRNVHLLVHYREDQIRERLGDGRQWGLDLRYVHEPQPLGTAGGLRLLPADLAGPLLVVNGDIMTAVNFRRLLSFHEAGGQKATVAVRQYAQEIPFGVVRLEGEKMVAFDEKPTETRLINAGMYVLDASLRSFLPPEGYFNMPDLIRSAMASGLRVAGFLVHEYWLDIGQPDDYRRANLDARGPDAQ